MLTEEKYQRWNSGTSAWDNMYWARYLYDTAGNMVSRVVDQIVNGSSKDYNDFGFTYSRGYQLTGFTRTIGPETRVFTLTYDANGNMTHISQNATFTDTFYNITEMEFQFDEKNRMTHYRFGGSGSYYQIKYDALGRVRERVDLTPTTSKYYSDGRQLIQQLDNSDNVDFDYFRGPTGLMRQLDVDASNKKRFYIKDPLGTVLALVNPSDLSVKHYNYNSWGEHLDKDDTDFPTDENLMRYIGCRVEAFGDSTAQTDAIYHLDHRHYLPFLSSFSIREPRLLFGPRNLRNKVLNINPYNYSYNNPALYSDPSGLYPWDWEDCCYIKGIRSISTAPNQIPEGIIDLVINNKLKTLPDIYIPTEKAVVCWLDSGNIPGVHQKTLCCAQVHYYAFYVDCERVEKNTCKKEWLEDRCWKVWQLGTPSAEDLIWRNKEHQDITYGIAIWKWVNPKDVYSNIPPSYRISVGPNECYSIWGGSYMESLLACHNLKCSCPIHWLNWLYTYPDERPLEWWLNQWRELTKILNKITWDLISRGLPNPIAPFPFPYPNPFPLNASFGGSPSQGNPGDLGGGSGA